METLPDIELVSAGLRRIGIRRSFGYQGRSVLNRPVAGQLSEFVGEVVVVRGSVGGGVFS